MRICIITSTYPNDPSGNDPDAALFIRDFALELAKQDNKVFILVPKRDGKIVDDKILDVRRFGWIGKRNKLNALKVRNPVHFFYICSLMISGQYNLLKTIRKEKIDYVIALWALPSGFWAYLAKKILNTPYIVWCLGSDIWIYGRKKSTKKIIVQILKDANLRYGDGEKLRKEMESICSRKCAFLPTTRILPKQKKDKKILDMDKINYLFIGRYHYTKGADILLEAINILDKHTKKKCAFYFYGGGDQKEMLIRKKVEYGLDNVMINDSINAEEVSLLMNSADYLIIPSRFDSIPIIFSEALQFKLPMIVSDVGDMEYLVKKFDIGYTFKSKNMTELANRISDSTSQNNKSFKENCNKALKTFDIKKSVDRMLKEMRTG